MKRFAFALGLVATVTCTGCYRAEQERAAQYESFLKRTLGVAGRDEAAPAARISAPHDAAPATAVD